MIDPHSSRRRITSEMEIQICTICAIQNGFDINFATKRCEENQKDWKKLTKKKQSRGVFTN